MANKKEINKESFFYKYKNDKKYKAKAELTGYVIFILLVILFVNIASLGNKKPITNLNNDPGSTSISWHYTIDDSEII